MTSARILLFFGDVWANLRWVDVIDVLVVTVIFYTAITWFRTARSRFVLIGLGVLGALYVVARALDMYLTLLLFQAAITVAVFALVVIFQEEIRRAFERLGSTHRLKFRRSQGTSSDIAQVVVQTLSALAHQKTGALVVFKGTEPLERHLSGGIELDGQLSPALLQSIFDSSSAGHDGAVIIDSGLVRKFAVHLPLASNRSPETQTGTRHAAAVGLSERSDAFVVVVSEERGTLSVAKDGRLTVVAPDVLRSRLNAFLRDVSPAPKAEGVVRRMFSDPGAKAMSLAMAVATWLFLFGSHGEVSARTYTVPVGYHDLPDGWILEEPKPLQARITLSGNDRAFQQIDPSSLMISLDASHIRAGAQKLSIQEKSLSLPPRISLHSVEPEVVTVVAYDTVTREVTVRPQTTGKLAVGLWLKGLHANPTTVPIVFKRTESSPTMQLLTEPIDLGTLTDTVILRRKLEAPKGARLAASAPATVEVTVEVGTLPKPGADK